MKMGFFDNVFTSVTTKKNVFIKSLQECVHLDLFSYSFPSLFLLEKMCTNSTFGNNILTKSMSQFHHSLCEAFSVKLKHKS